MIPKILSTLNANNMLNSASKEIGGSNIPHIVLVANKNELIDQAINQFGNTAVVFGGGYLFDRVINKIFQALHPAKFAKTAFINPVSQAWYMLGKSFAIYSFIASYVIASPFIRNYITLKRTKANNFTEMVGLTDHPKSPQDERELKRKESSYLHKFIRIWGTGIGISAAFLAATQLLLAKQTAFPAVLKKVHKLIGLPKGEYKHLTDQAAYLFWAVPAYIGLYTGSRDKLEKKETLFKAGGFGLAFMLLPRTLKWVATKFLDGKNFPIFGPGKNVAYLIQLLSGMVFYASIPTIINLFKRKDRASQMGLLNQPATPQTPAPGFPPTLVATDPFSAFRTASQPSPTS